jgi:uncharacterized YigZ family protein
MTNHADGYRVLTGMGLGRFSEKASRFIGIAHPATSSAEVKDLVAALRREHPGARHFCHASVFGADGAEQRSSDDGEPSGTAGRPILRRIIAAGFTDTAVVVVRHFGGTLLGKGGLVQAYGEAAQLALEAAPWEQRWRMTTVRVLCPHAHYQHLRLDVERAGGRIREAVFLGLIEVVVELPGSSTASMTERWMLRGLSVSASA